MVQILDKNGNSSIDNANVVILDKNGKVKNINYTGGTVTSIDLTMPSAFNVTGNPIVTAGTLAVSAAGLANQYIRGDGQLSDFPGSTGGGSSVSYYLNGSVLSSVAGYYQMSRIPVVGGGTNFSIATNGYIAQFITDPLDPSLLSIPSGSWNIQFYMSASSSGGTPNFYVELYKYDGVTFTLVGNSSTSPEYITGATSIDLYYTSVAVPTTTLTLTDRLAVRVYVNNSARTITLHTENDTLAQIITTFTTGLTAINGLTNQVQFLSTGTVGTDFNIDSVSIAATHIFNIPTASTTNRGALSSTDWSTFNGKQNALSGTGFVKISGTTISYDNSTYYLASNPDGYITSSALAPYLLSSTAALTYYAIPIGTTSQYIRGDGSLATFPTIPVVTPSALTKVDDTNVTLTLGGTPSTALLQATSLTLGWTGTLDDSRITSAAAWNAKFNLPSLTSGSVLFSNGTTIAQDNANFFWDDTNNRLGIGTNAPTANLHIKAPGALSTDIALRVRNSADTGDILNVRGDNNIIATNLILTTLDCPSYVSQGATSGIKFNIGPVNQFTGTSGALTVLYVAHNSGGGFRPTSGTATHTTIELNSTINQTGTANGITRGLYVNPTLTAAADYRAIETTVGKVILNGTSGNTLIGTTTDIASSKLTIASTTQGFLPPRMTTTEKNAIATPATGLEVFDTTLGVLSQYDGTTWNTYQKEVVLTSGSVLFSNGTTIAENNSNFFWDNTNNRLGIGTAAPNYPLHVKGDILVEGASGSETIWMSGGSAVSYSGGKLILQSSIYIDSNNSYVGIGTSIPTAKLHVAAQGSLSTDIAFKVRDVTDTDDMVSINGTGNVLIGTNADQPSSKLTIGGNTQGFLPPRLSTLEKNGIISPATGLEVYDTTLGVLSQYDGVAWNNYQKQITLTTTGTSGAATLIGDTLNIPQYSSGGGPGTVTNVSVTTANGISGTVLNPTTTPAITLTLGNITPTSVNGNVFTTGSSTYTGTPGAVYTFPTVSEIIAANDGSNLTIPGQAIGDILVASSTTSYGKLAAVATGSFLMSQGTGTAPVYQNTRQNYTSFAVSGTNAVTTGQTLVDITGLNSGTLPNSTTYEVEALLYVSTSAVTTGTQYAITGGGTGNAAGVSAIVQGTTTTNAAITVTQSASATAVGTFLTTSGTFGIIKIKGICITRSSGTANISIQHLKVTSGASTVRIGSYMKIRLLN